MLAGGGAAGGRLGHRMKGVVVERPIIYGSAGFWLKNKPHGQASHRWVAYVRGVYNEDLSGFVRKVVFTLHESFPKPVRVVKKPPYEISEFGWGEFILGITIYFADYTEQPISLNHYLRLFPANDSQPTELPVISEHLDEIVFVDVHEEFYHRLIGSKSRMLEDIHAKLDKLDTQEKALDEEEAALLEEIKRLEQEHVEMFKASP